ncbi:hypothetical protein [Mycobacteroides salmoniphilum]|uniref:hypothetical protein n=1 Tax=Mycobacteroides salmoniphilum TaxID=404941 RepID=UPI0010F0A7E9|nr:hypothetical protein [Mycobacteroides salmoniphilum]TDZ75796.1 hypothetical protein DE4586_03689 [Mycobacteroides salmoniphilum]TDZ84314.1 hypothetical protein DE4587_03230 [Mycobacteroides salmoniphilum]
MRSDRSYLSIVERAQQAQRKAELARDKTRDQLQEDIDRIHVGREEWETRADKAAASAGSAWAELGASWKAHVARVKIAFGHKEHRIDARLAERDADIAEFDAAYAVDIAFSAIEEAEDTVLYAMYARKYAEEIAS